MGCGATKAVRVAPQSVSKDVTMTTFTETEQTMNLTGVTYREIVENYDFLVNNCGSFKCPPGSVPIACLTEDAIPVVQSALLLDDSRQTGIYLPVIAANIKKTGRIVCFGHIKMLNRNYFNYADTANLMHNAFMWLNGKKSIINPIQFVSFPKEFYSEIKACFSPHGIHVSFVDFHPDLANQSFIVIPTYFDPKCPEKRKVLKDVIQNGGGVGVFYVSQPNQTAAFHVQMNEFLLKFGLSYTYCSLSDDCGSSCTVNVHDNYEQSKKHAFYPLVDRFDSYVTAKSANVSNLDDLVTAIRYHVLVSGRNQFHLIDQLLNLCWNYLNDTNYRLENGMICPEVGHSIITVLMQELYIKIPVDRIKAVADAATYPGLAVDVCADDYTIDLPLVEESLISTGFWLQPGVLATVECLDAPKNMRVQIGSHPLSLLTKPGPWKRWPMIVSSFSFNRLRNEVASPFGGIVYIALSELPEDCPKSLKITFKKFNPYPMCIYNDPTVYERTSKYNVPWGELCSKSIIFTLPSKKIAQITDFDEEFQYIENIITAISEYMNYPIIRPYRIVFDVETVEDQQTVTYPIVLPDSDIDDILFTRGKPTGGLFRAVSAIALVSLRDQCFDSITEKALAAFVAANVFTKVFAFFDPIEQPIIEMPLLFNELWLIHMQVNRNIIPAILRKSQEPDCKTHDVPEDMWISFVRDLCDSAKLNFTTILERARPIPLNVISNLDGLKNAPPLQI